MTPNDEGAPMQRLVKLAQQLRYVWYLVAALAIAAGFDFRSPKRQFAELRVETTELRATIDTIKAQDLRLREIELYYLYGLTHTSCQLLGREHWGDSPLPCRQIIEEKKLPTDVPSLVH